MFFWTYVLAHPPGPKLPFLNHLAMSTKLCPALFICRNSMPHRCLILFIKFLPFCISSLFIRTSFNFYLFLHSPLFMIRTLLLCNWLAIFSESTCSATVSWATSCVCWVWNWFWSISSIKVWNYARVKVHPGLPGTPAKAIILVVLPLQPDSVIDDLITQQPYRRGTIGLQV